MLEIGVGGKRDDGVEVKVPTESWKTHWIQWQIILKHEDDKSYSHLEHIQNEGSEKILLPAHPALGVNTSDLVDRRFYGI